MAPDALAGAEIPLTRQCLESRTYIAAVGRAHCTVLYPRRAASRKKRELIDVGRMNEFELHRPRRQTFVFEGLRWGRRLESPDGEKLRIFAGRRLKGTGLREGHTFVRRSPRYNRPTSLVSVTI